MKTVIVTGASSGLGKEIALQLGQSGINIILVARSEDRLKAVCSEIGKNASYIVCDINSISEISRMVSEISEVAVDALVNNAGVWTDDSLEADDPDSAKRAIDVNLHGNVNVTQAILPLLKRNSAKTRILNVLSTAAVHAIPAGNNQAWKMYGASKWAIDGYMQNLKEELRDTNVQVLNYYPGGFESDLYENAGRPESHNQPWMMKTKDVAEIVTFMLTRPDDIYIESLVVSKGM